MSGYRDDIDAAQARIAQLEEEVRDLKQRLALTPAMQERLADLHRDRDAAARTLATLRERGSKSFRFAVALVVMLEVGLVGAIASLGSSGHPVNAAMLGAAVAVSVLAMVQWFDGRKRSHQREHLATLDREITALEAPDPVRVEPTRTRVDTPDTDEASESSEQQSRRRSTR